jgi:hypothetical protein
MTHQELVERAVRWLRNTQRCTVVVGEFYWWGGECPDAMGWKPDGTSQLVECKASVSDFYADRKKPWRRNPELGMGMRRWYMTPKGLLNPTQLPEGWGLLECRGRVVRIIRVPNGGFPVERRKPAATREIKMLVNIIRRISEGRLENLGRIHKTNGAQGATLDPEARRGS